MKINIPNKVLFFLWFFASLNCEARDENLDELRNVENKLEELENNYSSKHSGIEQQIEKSSNTINLNRENLNAVKQKLVSVNKKIEETSCNEADSSSQRNWSRIIKTGAMITLLAGTTAATGGASAYLTVSLVAKLVGTTAAATAAPTSAFITLIAPAGVYSLAGSAGAVVGAAIGLEGGIRSVEEHGAVTLDVALEKTCESTLVGTLIGTAVGGKKDIDWDSLLSKIDNAEKV